MNSQYEEEIIRLFVEKDRQERFLYKLSFPDGSKWVRGTMANAMYFDSRCITRLPKKLMVQELYALLKAKGAGEEAYMFARDEELDGQIVPLLDGLNAVIGQCSGDFVYCIDGQVGYYEADGRYEYFIIHKPEKTIKKS